MKEEVLNTVEAVAEHLESLSDTDIIYLHNHYCDCIHSGDDRIYDNDEEFFNVYFSDVMSAVRAIFYGEYNYTDKFVKFNGYANLETTNDPLEWIDVTDIAEHIIDNEHEYRGVIDFELVEEEEEVEDSEGVTLDVGDEVMLLDEIEEEEYLNGIITKIEGGMCTVEAENGKEYIVEPKRLSY